MDVTQENLDDAFDTSSTNIVYEALGDEQATLVFNHISKNVAPRIKVEMEQLERLVALLMESFMAGIAFANLNGLQEPQGIRISEEAAGQLLNMFLTGQITIGDEK